MKEWVPPLAKRIARTTPLIDCRSPGHYFEKVIRSCLQRATIEGWLEGGSQTISRHIRLDRRSAQVPEQGAQDLIGGPKNFRRRKDDAVLHTPDGGWLSFSAVLRPYESQVEVLAYNFERVYDARASRWLRFDLNPSGHDNDHRGLRAHFHPSSDDLQFPSPIFAPHELIDLLLAPPIPPDDRKPRTKGEPSAPA
ncbi:hypothetical protein [Paraliomyxa miuraensis]|uniref:hypothetical protein n=1 Tax=Paraliomyxa miuraensis TaxID=376150 RepID=UPI00225B1518|nr:hypothetical protein [Paraliomyxa miuraensis]MCX4242100.1 hypothetical protein [Paraliomyxa miuraensis]